MTEPARHRGAIPRGRAPAPPAEPSGFPPPRASLRSAIVAAIVAAGVLVSAPVLAEPGTEVAQGAGPAPGPTTPPPAGDPVDASEPAPDPDAEGDGEVEGEVIEIIDRAPPGAQSSVSAEVLDRAEHDDVHRVLAGIAGVYIRSEDGYGLRPNIGMRGAAAERSAKIALMEDGVLIAPAPYSAPAAYYFPLVTRMSRIEVVKGPAAIQYGPNTVGGAVDLIGEPMPGERGAYVDLAGGTDRYGKLHARAVERRRRWGVMAELVKLRTDGFKQLDGGGDTGFDKNDGQLSLRVSSDPADRVYHQLDVKVGYATETSNETYTGLTDTDFAAAPQRRYAATQLDRMEWDHWRMRATHRVELPRARVETVAYRHVLDRAWGKVDGFVGQRDLNAVLADPTAGSNPVFHAILTGTADSASPEEELIRGTNDRRFASQGVQSKLSLETSLGPVAHHADVGVRIHFDRADRRRFEDAYRMVGGALVASDRPRALVLDTRAETTALAAFVQDRAIWGRLEVGAGTRIELIDARIQDWMTGAYHEHAYSVIIPGAGALYHVTDELAVLAGVHRGFVPVAPTATGDVRPELSVNYEAGARWRSALLSADVIGFYSDYANLKGSCTLSSGCMTAQEGDEFNGGAVRVWGAEVQLATRPRLAAGLELPIEAAYTLTRSAFQTAFSSEFAGWDDVMVGDELPYLPVHQVSVAATVVAPRWQAGASAQWHGELRDVAGQGPIDVAERGDALLTIGLSAHAQIRPWAEAYATCTNLLDEQVIVSRRPYCARPNPPRQIVVGYKGRF
jgi:Fe(3+) dicitrate transport protein